jgi:hypothetical protein
MAVGQESSTVGPLGLSETGKGSAVILDWESKMTMTAISATSGKGPLFMSLHHHNYG